MYGLGSEASRQEYEALRRPSQFFPSKRRRSFTENASGEEEMVGVESNDEGTKSLRKSTDNGQEYSCFTSKSEASIPTATADKGGLLEHGTGGANREDVDEWDEKKDPVMQNLVERLVDRLGAWLDARTKLAAMDKDKSLISQYQDAEGLSAANKMTLSRKLKAVEEAEKGYEEARLGLTCTFPELMRAQEAAKKSEDGMTSTAEATLCSMRERGIQTINSPRSSTSEEAEDALILSELLQDQAKKLDEIKETERTLIEAAAEKISAEVEALLPALVTQELAASEARRLSVGQPATTRSSVDEESLLPAQSESSRMLKQNIESLSQSVAEIQADQRRLHASIAALADDAMLHTEALQRRQSVDRELHDVLANHALHVARHEEMLYNLTNLIGLMPKPQHSFGSTPIAGISEELIRTALATANTSSNSGQ